MMSHRTDTHPANFSQLPPHLEECVQLVQNQMRNEPRILRGRNGQEIVEYSPEYDEKVSEKGFIDYAIYAPPEEDWSALYRNNTVNSQRQTYIKGMRLHHIKRYITNGRTKCRSIFNKSKILHRDGKVTEITGAVTGNGGQQIYVASVLSQRTQYVEYRVKIKLTTGFTTFQSTRDIEQCECECQQFQNSPYDPPICKHIGAVLAALEDKTYPVDQLILTSSIPSECFQVT